MNVGPSSSIASRIRVSRFSRASTCPLRFLNSDLPRQELKTAQPTGESVLAQDRQDFTPAIHVAIKLRDGADTHEEIQWAVNSLNAEDAEAKIRRENTSHPEGGSPTEGSR